MQLFSNRRKSNDEEIKVEKPAPEPEKTPEAPTPAPGIPVKHPIGFDTVLGTGCTVEGTLSTEGNIRIDGTLTGTLNITGNVLVGESAQVNADIDAANVSIAGSVKGNVSGNKVQLLRTARVWGDIAATSLSTEEGAFIEGKISMQNAASVKSPFNEQLDDDTATGQTQVGTTTDVTESIIVENEETDD